MHRCLYGRGFPTKDTPVGMQVTGMREGRLTLHTTRQAECNKRETKLLRPQPTSCMGAPMQKSSPSRSARPWRTISDLLELSPACSARLRALLNHANFYANLSCTQHALRPLEAKWLRDSGVHWPSHLTAPDHLRQDVNARPMKDTGVVVLVQVETLVVGWREEDPLAHRLCQLLVRRHVHHFSACRGS